MGYDFETQEIYICDTCKKDFSEGNVLIDLQEKKTYLCNPCFNQQFAISNPEIPEEEWLPKSQ